MNSGDQVVVHGLRGRRSNRSLPSETRWAPFWNDRFTVAPVDPLDAHRPVPPDIDLEALFAETDTWVVARDFTVCFENRFWQVTARDAEAAGVTPGSPVVFEPRLSGELRFRHRGCYLTPKALGAVRSATPKPAPAPATAKPRPKPSKPGRNHRGASTSAPAWPRPWPSGNTAPPTPTGPVPCGAGPRRRRHQLTRTARCATLPANPARLNP